MSFSAFQTATGTLRKLGTDKFGNQTTLESYECRADPTMTETVAYNKDGQTIRGDKNVLDGLPVLDETHDKWELDFKGKTYHVEKMTGYPMPGSDKPSHYEVLLR